MKFQIDEQNSDSAEEDPIQNSLQTRILMDDDPI